MRPSATPVDILTDDNISNAISANNLTSLCSLLETQDRRLMNQLAEDGSPEIAAYILSRHPNVPPADYSSHLLSPDPILHPVQFLVKKAAYHGNAQLFRYLVTEYPTLLTTYNRNFEAILLSAMNGGTSIWKIILEVDPRFKDHEFSGHRGCTLENVVWRGFLVEGDEKIALLQLLLKGGC
ncbi:MAG: hypothetical protein Q9226_001977 [Calogaya cf. arnoldii]